jgi:hypothetical protein
MIRPFDEASLGRVIPWTGHHLDEVLLGRGVLWTMRPSNDPYLGGGGGCCHDKYLDVAKGGDRSVRDASYPNGRIVQGTEHPRLFVRGHVGRGNIVKAYHHQRTDFLFCVVLYDPSLWRWVRWRQVA